MNCVIKEFIWYAEVNVKRFSSQLLNGQNKLECFVPGKLLRASLMFV
jgi:hypothetical protein